MKVVVSALETWHRHVELEIDPADVLDWVDNTPVGQAYRLAGLNVQAAAYAEIVFNEEVWSHPDDRDFEYPNLDPHGPEHEIWDIKAESAEVVG